MIVNFFLGFFSSEGQWVFENGPIACHYLKYVSVCDDKRPTHTHTFLA